jgi:hypothetical protein
MPLTYLMVIEFELIENFLTALSTTWYTFYISDAIIAAV